MPNLHKNIFALKHYIGGIYFFTLLEQNNGKVFNVIKLYINYKPMDIDKYTPSIDDDALESDENINNETSSKDEPSNLSFNEMKIALNWM